MNILEAIKTGKRFYRKSWNSRSPITFADVQKLSEAAMLAEDWEVAPCFVTLSSEGFDDAVKKVNVKLYKLPGEQVHISDFLKELKEELGL